MQVVVVMMMMVSLSLLGFQNASEILTTSSAAVAFSYCCFIRFSRSLEEEAEEVLFFILNLSNHLRLLRVAKDSARVVVT
jgi:hypothetical protein